MLALNKVLEAVQKFVQEREEDKVTFLSVAEAKSEEVLFADKLTEDLGEHVDVKLVRSMINSVNIAKESK